MTVTTIERLPVRQRENSLFTTAFKRFLAWHERRKQQKIDRDAFRQLLSLDQHILDDIGSGLTRDDVKWAASQPLEMNAALELQRLSKSRRKTQ